MLPLYKKCQDNMRIYYQISDCSVLVIIRLMAGRLIIIQDMFGSNTMTMTMMRVMTMMTIVIIIIIIIIIIIVIIIIITTTTTIAGVAFYSDVATGVIIINNSKCHYTKWH